MAKTTSSKSEKLNVQIAQTEKEIRQLENRCKRLAGSQSQLERKARTRRLIERGAMLEGFIPEAETLTNEQIMSVLMALFHTTAAAQALEIAREPAADSSLV
ncbi:DUF3847 domain-containing protein [Ruminococcaceae bacterium OttesenSCG-928-A11]|nr:DUF3847 domain-containing protein [Ruminococcaceae bacterium OttesenSCG-928-A11]